MSTELTPVRQLAIGLTWVVFIAGTLLALDATTGKTEVGAPLASGALPPEVAVTTEASQGSAAAPFGLRSSATSHRPRAKAVSMPRPGIPVAIDIPFASSHHPSGVHATVRADPLNPDGTLYVPADPRAVSWAKQDAAPGSDHGTVILTSHIDFVIDGVTVQGALADLAEYARTSVGKRFTVRLTDGRRIRYQVVAGREYNKEQLAADPTLRQQLYNQGDSFGRAGAARTSRLLLVSCGGAFDNATGEYEDNVFLYALPA
ncbi:MAG: hypothetical protein QOH14_492 [Pseudonocardiales bacterium]|nr:hypothetical protein [Pseudonocardiales bacterium]